MKETGWGREPFDLRLTLLRMLRRLPLILGLTVLGIAITWGSYYLKNVTFNQTKTYSASATFFVDYADENWYVNAKYFNDYTWNVWMKADEVLDSVDRYLKEKGITAGENVSFDAQVPADNRVIIIRSIAPNPQLASERLHALESALTVDFTEFVEEIREIRIVDETQAALDVLDLRLGRAFILSLIVSAAVALCYFLLSEFMRDALWLPTSLTDRFGLKSLGIPGDKTYAENLKYFFAGKKSVAVFAAQDGVDLSGVMGELEKAGKETGLSFFAVEDPMRKEGDAKKLREADGSLLVVKAGGRNGRYLELLLSFLAGQDCNVTAATIWKPDKWLLRLYYCLEREKEK